MAGDFDAQELEELCLQYFGTLEPKEDVTKMEEAPVSFLVRSGRVGREVLGN